METFTLSSHNGTDRYTCYVYPVDKPRAMLQICHGMCEYIDRYAPFIRFLNEQNILVFGHDHVGHGNSVTDDSMLGFFGEKDGNAVLALDAHALGVHMKNRYPTLPLYLMGHSMGSFVARDYIAKYGSELSGAVIMGTAGSNKAIDIAIALSAMVAKTRGKMHRSKLIKQLAFGTYTSHFENPESGFDWLTKDRAIIDAYEKDPHCNFIFTAKGFEDLFRLIKRISGKQWADKVPKNLPIYLVAGEDDPVGNYGKGVMEVYQNLKSAGVRDVEIKLYPNCRHEILNEPEKTEVYADILAWLNFRF